MDEYNTNQTYIDETQMNNDGQQNTSGTQKKKMDPKKKQRIISGIVGAIVAFVAIIVVVITSLPKDKVFTKLEMKITLTNEFKEDDRWIDYLTAYTNDKVVVLVNKDSFESVEYAGLTSTSTIKEYLQKLNQIEGTYHPIETEGNLSFMYWNTESGGTTYYYRAYAYKSQSAFWLIQFACKYTHKSDYLSSIKKYAASVKFTDATNNI